MKISVVVAACALAVAAASTAAAPARAAAPCSEPYQYAGVVAPAPTAGVAATISALAVPDVRVGHVAAWVGVGGPGAGAGGADEWLQVGLSDFASGAAEVYYEVTLPGTAPAYTAVRVAVAPHEMHRVAVLEVAGRPGWWRAWVDGAPASEAIFLPGSHDVWRPMAMAESSNSGDAICNGFSYAFADLRLASLSGGTWRAFARRELVQLDGYRVLAQRGGGFVATGD